MGQRDELMPKTGIAALSERETAVLELVADGLSNEGIAARLFISVKRVEAALGSVFLKLGLSSEDRQENRRVKAALQFAAQRTLPGAFPIDLTEFSTLLASAPFDTMVNVLRQRAEDAGTGAWGLLAAAAWGTAIGDDLAEALELARQAEADVAWTLGKGPTENGLAARIIVDGLLATLQAMHGDRPLGHTEMDRVAELAGLPLRNPRRATFDAMESVLEIANWFTFSDRPTDAGAILDRRLYRVEDKDDFSENSALCCLVELDIRRGRWTRCDATLDRLIEREATRGNPSGYAHSLAARLHAGRGDVGRTRSHLQAARAGATARADHSTRWRADAAEGLLLLGIGDVNGAVSVLGPHGESMDGAGPRLSSVRMWEADLVEAQVGVGDLGKAERTTKRLQVDVTATGSLWGNATLERCEGLLAGTPSAAAARFQSSAAEFAKLDAPFEQARSELLLGRSLGLDGQPSAAQLHLDRAATIFESVGAGVWLRTARKS